MTFYDLSFRDVTGNEIDFGRYRGMTCLLVNIASECGYAGQMHDLQSLYLLYKNRGFAVFAFPSNDFGKQEPRGNAEIQSYCSSEYMVTFPVFEKSHVKGPEVNQVYRFLQAQQRFPFIFRKPLWNFQKYLIDRNGSLADVFLPTTSPRTARFRHAIERCLNTIPAAGRSVSKVG